MTTALHTVKIIFAVGFIVAGTVALWLARDLALPLFVGGIAWCKIPE